MDNANSLRIYLHHLDEPTDWLSASLASLSSLPVEIRTTSKGRTIGQDMADAIASVSASADTDYIMFANPDNLYDASVIQTMLEALQAAPSAPLVYCDEEISTLLPGAPLARRNLPYNLNRHYHCPDLVHTCVIYRTSACLPYINNITRLHVLAEWYLTLALSLEHAQPLHVPAPGRIYRQHAGQAHRSLTNEERSQFNELRSQLTSST